MDKEDLEYVDMNNRPYKLGDVVLNNYFGDYWVVGKYSDNSDISKYEEDCPFFLAQYGNPDYYFMDLDEPKDFSILKSVDEEGYEELLEMVKALGKEINKNE